MKILQGHVLCKILWLSGRGEGVETKGCFWNNLKKLRFRGKEPEGTGGNGRKGGGGMIKINNIFPWNDVT